MSITDILNTDTIIHILDYLKDYDKMNFMKTCKEYYHLRDSVNYTDLYEFNDIKNLSFNNKFKRLIYRGFYVNDNMDFSKCEKKFVAKNLREPIPNGTTHLYFKDKFNQDIKGYIPNSVIFIKFGWDFCQNIKDCIRVRIHAERIALCCIPNSVKYLLFEGFFNRNIKDCIPNGVEYLRFGCYFNQDIKDCIPNSVTHLILG
ncbi:putative F-box and FNIP repeat-containing protein [Megavirus courdo11]|uniref:Putative F-box and FNIP repeat-containing protein n=1 Tax=Megavirus courdo11 TaxID=1128140 RepID=K7YFQ2_9VIRU|nr:putative F-box and FNIP repeat-containing protein [Megavirus courdo11]AVL94082.1 putative F-box and FNIP repeat-containing protein [Megavirus vitis]